VVGNPIKVVVVDDESLGRRLLKALIDIHESLRWVGEADSVESGAAIVQREKPDAIFLDIHMPEADGFDLLHRLVAPPKVVFVTASPTHAVQAFEVAAVDYLLKPVLPKRFAATVQRLERVISQDHSPAIRHEITDSLCLRTTERTVVVPLQQIIALQAEGDFTRIFAAGEDPILICRSLGEYEEILPMPPFLRLDRSMVVNTIRIQQVERLSRGSGRVWLRGLDDALETGRTANERLREAMKTSLPVGNVFD